LNPRDARGYLFGPRRIAFTATIDSETGKLFSKLRGPKLGAPEAAIVGFARKNSASTENLEVENGYFVLRRNFPARAAADIITKDLPIAVAKLSWQKSMRWGQSNGFTWVRPLRRSVCLLDGQIVPITIGPITANGETEGHRFLSPGGIIVKSYKHWMESLHGAKVLVDATSRRAKIRQGLIATAKAHNLSIVEDDELLEEVSGLVEWPVPLIGRIDADFMDLPTEVRELSMKVNQRYFALRDSDGRPAPYFAFVSNIEAP
jgi:glycyl-tRNA synthetase beta chain